MISRYRCLFLFCFILFNIHGAVIVTIGLILWPIMKWLSYRLINELKLGFCVIFYNTEDNIKVPTIYSDKK